MSAGAQDTWQAELGRALAAGGVEAAAWVPDKRLDPIAATLAREGVPLRTLTREDECFAWAAGFRAAGGVPLVLVQCSGLGNSLNAIGSLIVPYGLGVAVVVSMRGGLGERNPSQMPIGRSAVGMLGLLGIQAFTLRRAGDVAAVVAGALDVAAGARELAPIILEPDLDLPR
jgi:sulfopyruvate decarboxylase TPP-binding subunit